MASFPALKGRKADGNDRPGTFSYCLVGGLISFLFLISCASLPPPPVKPAKEVLFRSHEYVVYGLQRQESPEELAERFLGDRRKAWIVEEANPNIAFHRGQVVIIPLKIKNIGGLSPQGYQTVPVLTYHRFAEQCESALCIPTSVFDHQMKYLKENGFRSVTPDEILSFMEYRSPLPKKAVWITMDDGYRSVYNIAYPILKKYGFTATFFVYTDFIGVSKTAITWDQLREMKSEGFTVGSHTIFHSDLSKQKETESEAEWIARIKKELNGSKEIIDKKLNQETFWLAYPFGNYDQRVMRLSKEAGYKIAVSVKRGGNPFFSNPFSLRRDQILSRDIKKFASRLTIFNHLPLE